MGTNTTVITPPPLKFGINEVVYVRESALLGYLEALKVARAYYNPKIARNVYVFLFRKNKPDVQISGDAIDLLSNKKIALLEEDLVTFEEALSIKYNALSRELTKTNQQLAKYGKPQIDVDVSEGTDFGDVPAGEPSAGAGGHLDKTHKVLNEGELDLLLTGSPRVAVLGDEDDFIVMEQPASQIESGSNSEFIVRFAPAALGRRVAVILIVSNDPLTPNFAYSVEGVGI